MGDTHPPPDVKPSSSSILTLNFVYLTGQSIMLRKILYPVLILINPLRSMAAAVMHVYSFLLFLLFLTDRPLDFGFPTFGSFSWS